MPNESEIASDARTERGAPVRCEDLLGWLRVKLADAEKALRCREEGARVWRSGTDESWAAAAEIHPSTRGKPMTRAQRLQVAEIEDRVAVKYRREVEMFKAVIAALGSS